MRAGPLSNPKVIEILNKYYVAVTSANELAGDFGKGPPAEKAERARIYGEFLKRKLPVGDVHVYILGPDASPVSGLDLGVTEHPDQAADVLLQVATQLHTVPGPPAVTPRPQSAPPPADADSLIFHLVSRRLPLGGSWNEYPAENWIVLPKADWTQMLPPSDASVKTSWDIPVPVAAKLVEWLYPQNEETKRENRSRVDIAALHFTITTLKDGIARARIDGKVRLRHSFYPGRPAEDYADSKLLGYADFDLTKHEIQRIRMVTTQATYTTFEFGASIVTVAREAVDAPTAK